MHIDFFYSTSLNLMLNIHKYWWDLNLQQYTEGHAHATGVHFRHILFLKNEDIYAAWCHEREHEILPNAAQCCLNSAQSCPLLPKGCPNPA